jgi:lysophospholipase L1-like esterase
MAEIKDTNLIRDALGSPVPQRWDETSQMYIARTVDGSFADVDFSKVRLLRDKLGSVIPQLWDVDTARFVPGNGNVNGDITIGSVTGLQSKLDNTTALLAETATKQDLANIGDAKPSGVYATLAALQAAFPTGNGKNIYLVAADGKWYYWNGVGAWIAGGVYQSTVISKASVSGDKTDFLKQASVNLFNPNAVTLESYVKVADGTVSYSGIFVASDYIPVTPGSTYTASSAFTKAFYDANKVFISAFDSAKVTAPANAVFLRTTAHKDSYKTFMLVQGGSLPSTFVSYDKYELDAKVSVPSENIKGLTVTTTQTDFISRTNRNLFDPSKIIPSKWVNTTGAIADTPSFSYAGMYPIEPNTQYITNGSTSLNAAFYDSNKVFISSFTNTKKTVFTSPPNAVFIALTIMPNEVNTYMLIKGNKIPVYYIPFEQYEFNSKINVATKSKWQGKRHGAIGDSITEYPVAHSDGTMMNYVDVVRSVIPFTEVRNMGKGGERMCDLVEILEHNGVTDADIANRDLITVFLGTNDKNTPLGSMADAPALSETSFYASIKGVIEYILTRNKTVRLAFITPLNGVNHTKEKNNAIKEVCAFYSIPVLDLFQTSGINPLNYSVYYGDAGVHPNSTGHYRIGEQIANFINSL